MLQPLLLGALILTLFVLIAGAALAIKSQAQPAGIGLVDGKLAPCPETPNCVVSESGADAKHAVDLLPGTDWRRLRTAVAQAGGVVVQDNGRYLHAVFTSSLFRFVDDVEARLDDAAGVIHIRSASRVGRSDFGVNRQRVAKIRRLMLQ